MRKAARVLLTALCIVSITGSATVYAEDTDKKIISGEQALGGFSMVMDQFYESVSSESKEEAEALSVTEELVLFNSRLAVAKVNEFVNIRQKPNTESDIVGRLYKSAIATYEGTEGEWTEIESNGVRGYVKTEYLLTDDAASKYAEDFYSNYITVESETVNVRSGPGLDYGVISTITHDTSLKVLGKEGDWYRVSTFGIVTTKEEGYVNAEYVTSKYRYAINSEEVKANDEINSTNVNHMIWPLPSDHRICTYYGPRRAPTAGASTFHRGLDIGGARGASVVAVLSGTVTGAGWTNGGGYTVEIDHGNGLVTRYLHNSKLCVSVGQYVKQGDVISKVGSTGISTSPHLHFSVVVNGSSVNPYPYLKRVQ